MESINALITETNNPATANISSCSTLEMVRLINAEDKKVALAVEQELPHIADAIDAAAARLSQGGRLFYVGAGTSGRLAVVDASECPCTYGVSPELVQAVLAGGLEAIGDAAQGDEDDADMGGEDLRRRQLTAQDVVVGITASGRTPYVLGAIRYAKQVGAFTIGLCSNPDAAISHLAALTIAPITGPEAIEGSTRMKSGTAQKMVLNMLSTGIMIRLGKVYGNRMVQMVANNEKLRLRAARMVADATGCPPETAAEKLTACGYDVKLTIAAVLLGCSPEEAAGRLQAAGDSLEALRREGGAL